MTLAWRVLPLGSLRLRTRGWRPRYPEETWREYAFGFVFDGDDEDGGPSGLFVVLFGLELEAYWPMHRPVNVLFDLGRGLKILRW